MQPATSLMGALLEATWSKECGHEDIHLFTFFFPLYFNFQPKSEHGAAHEKEAAPCTTILVGRQPQVELGHRHPLAPWYLWGQLWLEVLSLLHLFTPQHIDMMLVTVLR